MKKSYNIKLGDCSFFIDEDALELLEKSIARHVANSKKEGGDSGGNDTVDAVEAAIARELSQQVGPDGIVSFDIMRGVLDGACVLSDGDAACDVADSGNDKASDKEQNNEDASEKAAMKEPDDEAWRKAMTLGRKLFRNPVDSILGGVLSGMALYLNVGVTAMRLLFLFLFLFLFFTGTHIAFFMLLAYFVLWMAIPKAGNVIDFTRLRKPIISGNDSASLEQAWKANYDVCMTQMAFPKNRGCLYNFAKVVFVILLAIVALPFLVLLLSVAALFVFFVLVVLGAYGAAVYNNLIFVFAVAIPLLCLVHWILKKCGWLAPMNKYLKTALVAVWLALCVFGCAKLYSKIESDGGVGVLLENNVDKNLFNENFWQHLIETNIGKFVDEVACSYSAWIDNANNLPFAIDAKRSPAFNKITVRFMKELLPEQFDDESLENYEYSAMELSVSDVNVGSMFFIWNPVAKDIIVDVRNENFIPSYSMKVNSYDIPVRFINENDTFNFDNAKEHGMVPFEISFKKGSLPQLYIYGSGSDEGIFVPSIRNYMYGSVVYDNASDVPDDTTGCSMP